MRPRALIVAGGTGGHIFPALAVAEALRAHGVDPFWLGSVGGMEATLIPRHDIPLTSIRIGGIRGKGLWRRLMAPFNIVRATVASIRAILRIRPVVVLGMGGFVSGPCGLAAWICRRPLIIHEQNSIPGITNRLLSLIATRTLVAYPGSFAPSRRLLVTGNPLRAEIVALASASAKPTNREPLHVLVLGGSLGARSLNQTAPAALALLGQHHRLEVLHQTGTREVDETRALYLDTGLEARVTPFIEDMASTYQWADLVICRAGALTLAELCAAGLPAVLIPYPHAVDDHQTTNARHLVEHGAALVLADATLDTQSLVASLKPLLADEGLRTAMAAAARRLARPDATAAVANCCLEHARVSA